MSHSATTAERTRAVGEVFVRGAAPIDDASTDEAKAMAALMAANAKRRMGSQQTFLDAPPHREPDGGAHIRQSQKRNGPDVLAELEHP